MRGIVCGALCAALFASRAQALTVDLTTTGSTGSINGATFRQTAYSPTGSGVAGSFLRIQATGTEQGYNTGGGTALDTKGGVSLNNGDLSVSSFGATPALLLDVNEPTAGSTVTLTSLQVYTSSTHNLVTTDLSSLGTKVFDLNAGGTANSVVLDGGLSSGSGGGDALITFSPSLFAGAAPTDAVYVYASFTGAAGGFEEFLLVSNPADIPGGGQQPGVPEPASLALLPLGIAALATRYRRAV